MTNSFKSAVAFAVLVLLTLAALAGFMVVFAPQPLREESVASTDYSNEAMRKALDPSAVQAELETILAAGSRSIGQPGFTAVASRIEQTYRDAGLEVILQKNQTHVPITQQRRVLDDAGNVLEAVQIYPFLPNYFQPIVTPPGGLEGELVLLNKETLLTRPSFEGCIGVVSMDRVPGGHGLSWVRYSQLGLKGLLITHPDGFEAINWTSIIGAGGVSSTLPINYLRAAVSPEILQFLGKKVRVEVDVRFRTVDYLTIYGVLRAESPARDALLIPVNYDAFSVLPDLAPGAIQATPLATQLAMARGMAGYRSTLKRDVIFAAFGGRYMASDDETKLLQAIGIKSAQEKTREGLLQEEGTHQKQLQDVQQAIEFLQNRDLFNDKQRAVAELNKLPWAVRNLIETQLTHVLSAEMFRINFQLADEKIEFEKAGASDEAALEKYQKVLRKFNDASAMAGFKLERLIETRTDKEKEMPKLVAGLQERMKELAAFHEKRLGEIAQQLALNQAFSKYHNLVIFAPNLVPDPTTTSRSVPDQVAFVLGDSLNPMLVESRNHFPVLSNLAINAIRAGDLESEIQFSTAGAGLPGPLLSRVGGLPFGARQWNSFGYPAFALVNVDRLVAYQQIAFPVTVPYMRDLSGIRGGLALTGDLALSFAHGAGNFRPSVLPQPFNYSGTVFVAGMGQSLVPSFVLPNAYVSHKLPPGASKGAVGYYRYPFLKTDPYGSYSLLNSPTGMGAIEGYSPEAFWFGEEGTIQVIKDESVTSQRIYRSMALAGKDQIAVNIVTFPATPVGIADMINPQTLRLFEGVGLLAQKGLVVPPRINSFKEEEGVADFVDMDFRFFTVFKSGSAENELVRTIRAFMLGEPEPGANPAELKGLGYFAKDSTLLPHIAHDTAHSMLRVNQGRLDLQVRTGLADELTVQFQDQSRKAVEESQQPGLSQHARLLLERAAVTYAMIVHPVLQANLHAAVVSILWYLGLLVPFVFFFEKLVFGYSDIRKQLVAHSAIFLTVFLLLRILHPAFEIIRSSVMVLLGFIMVIFSCAVMSLFVGKFRENLEGLMAKRGRVKSADINTVGVMGVAFMLGLNNMHRRKIRTGLTCGTLVLITFSLICFTSIYSNFVDSEVAVGPGSYQGLLISRDYSLSISASEQFALETKYGHQYPISPRSMWVGTQNSNTREVASPEFEASYTSPSGESNAAKFNSVVHFSHREPLQEKIRLLTNPYWFPDPLEVAARPKRPADEPMKPADYPPILIPDRMAERLGITVDEVNAQKVTTQVNGVPYFVAGIFDSEAYEVLPDLNGFSLRPFDVQAMNNIRMQGSEIMADDDAPRLAAENLILAPESLPGLGSITGQRRLVSLVIGLQDQSYREAREEITQYLEQSGNPTYYGLDGVAYLGSRLRQNSFKGMVDMIIPLIIAAVTVLNTMRGSVYERKDEIYVYNAVGIAPKFIFMIFVAESLVYAVVGSMLGYLLSQGTGKVLTLMELTGGMNMTFASMTSVYASLAVFAAVLISAWFPARSAMKIAEPAEDSGWKLPDAVGDELSFQLPFTFDPADRIAILVLFERYLLDHGEGGAGRFSASPPEFGLKVDEQDRLVPQITCTIWLKPFDLAVSQRMVIDLPTDPETGEYIARVSFIRLSGSTESWQRLNHGFVGQLRRQFLHWRAVSPEQRAEFYDVAKSKLEVVLQARKDALTHG